MPRHWYFPRARAGALEGPLADYIIDFFGRQNFAMIRGAMSFIYTWGGVAGPVAPPLFIIGLRSIAPCYGRVAELGVTALAYSLLPNRNLLRCSDHERHEVEYTISLH